MTSRFFALGAVAALAAISAVSAVGPVQPRLHATVPPGTAKLQAFGSRSAEQRASAAGSKFDAALAEIARHLNRVRPDHALADLHALNPVAKFIQPADSAEPLVSIDAITLGDPAAAESRAGRAGSSARWRVFQRCRRMAAGITIAGCDGAWRTACHSRGDVANAHRRGNLAR